MSTNKEYQEEDPLSEPKNTQHIDLSKLSPQELKIYKMYGKLPTTSQILSSKFHDKKYFDSGDYAMQKQKGLKGVSGLGGNNVASNIPMRHPSAERMKEMSVRNSISATNAQIFANGKSGLLNESTPKPNTLLNKDNDKVSILFVNLGINNQGIDLVLEFTISFESFYNVPIFNFRVYHNNKLSFDLGGVNDILYWNREVEYLLIDHHILQNPWFQIHPCETSSTLDQHMQSFVEILEYEGDKAGKKKDLTVEYLKVWFNLYGLPTILPDFSLRSTIQ
ncbi:hypothetical protein KGF54_002636 [Candida jiufengensis]|uniref:uncharacterized protein n=1 Tax=Candida jiufengensis TaxID=497108 RepID=UPI0022242ABD|nr:uncharacterized protein KGF54_002636 [Candida jiufengensis]KAI5953265.1 hypothetical protein KGF54_002636 [Candida jiufengensis]